MAISAKKPPRKITVRVKPAAAAAAGSHHGQAMAVLQKFRLIFKSVKKHFHWVETETGVSGSQLWALAHTSLAAI
jgi:hypothetical protein